MPCNLHDKSNGMKPLRQSPKKALAIPISYGFVRARVKQSGLPCLDTPTCTFLDLLTYNQRFDLPDTHSKRL